MTSSDKSEGGPLGGPPAKTAPLADVITPPRHRTRLRPNPLSPSTFGSRPLLHVIDKGPIAMVRLEQTPTISC